MAVLRKQAAATSDANGNLSIVFAPPPAGTAWEGTINVPSAPSTAAWELQVDSSALSAGYGPLPQGELTVVEGETLTVLGTGLVPNTSYVAWLVGSAVPVDQAQALSPTPLPSVIGVKNPVGQGGTSVPLETTQLSYSLGAQSYGNPANGATGTLSFTLPAGDWVALRITNLANAIPDQTAMLAVWLQTIGGLTGHVGVVDQATTHLPLPAGFGPRGDCVIPLSWPYSAQSSTPTTLELNWACLVAASGNGSLQVEALSELPPMGELYRADGRPYPKGRFAAATSAAPPASLIAAPTAPGRIHLATFAVAIQTNAATGTCSLEATINGVLTVIAGVGAGTNGEAVDRVTPPGGLLCDPGTAVTMVASGAPPLTFSNALYDLVV